MSGHCKDCKWWAFHPIFEGSCAGAFCVHEKLRERLSGDSYENNALVYSYYEGGGFWTGPDFGCVHFEQKVESTQ